MKRIFILLAAAVCCLATTAQVRFGLKAGIGLNSLNLSNHTVQELACKDNCTGFTGGLLVEWETPVVGLCFDGALQYARRTNDLTKDDHWFKVELLDVNAENRDTRFLFTGDIGENAQRRIVSKYENESNKPFKIDLIKMPHHGSKVTIRFIDVLMPDYAVISASSSNLYGHPYTETLDMLDQAEVKLYRTDQSGDITVKSDGKRLSFTTEK